MINSYKTLEKKRVNDLYMEWVPPNALDLQLIT
jgi:hypothetical protein